MPSTEAIIYIDGGSRGNPGPAASAVIVKDSDGAPLDAFARFLGTATNNVAEYQALIEALKYALEHNYSRLQVVTDSELLERQITGRYKVNHPNIKPLYEQARQLIGQLTAFSIRHVLRGENSEADKLANQTLDAAKKEHWQSARLFRAAGENAGLKANQSPGPNSAATSAPLKTSARYRDGRLEPDRQLPLAEGETVQLEIRRKPKL